MNFTDNEIRCFFGGPSALSVVSAENMVDSIPHISVPKCCRTRMKALQHYVVNFVQSIPHILFSCCTVETLRFQNLPFQNRVLMYLVKNTSDAQGSIICLPGLLWQKIAVVPIALESKTHVSVCFSFHFSIIVRPYNFYKYNLCGKQPYCNRIFLACLPVDTI
jgi:hypothetical protein